MFPIPTTFGTIALTLTNPALRNFRNTIGSSLTNIIALSVGLTIVFFITVWVYSQLTYDRFHSRAKDIYLLVSRQESEAAFREYSPLVRPRPDLFARYPEVNATVGVVPLDEAAISNGDRSFAANGIGATRSTLRKQTR